MSCDAVTTEASADCLGCFEAGVSLWLTELRQETEEPHTEQLESVPCGQTLQDEDNSRREEKLSPVRIKDKRPHIPHS